MGYIIVILVLIIIVLSYGIYNLIRKNEILTDEIEYTDNIIEYIHTSLTKVYDRIKTIDTLGSFESDDETGFIFDEIKNNIEILKREFNLDGEETETE